MADKIIQLDDLFHSSAIINRSNITANDTFFEQVNKYMRFFLQMLKIKIGK